MQDQYDGTPGSWDSPSGERFRHEVAQLAPYPWQRDPRHSEVEQTLVDVLFRQRELERHVGDAALTKLMPIGTDCRRNTNSPSGQFQLRAYARKPANTRVREISTHLG